MNQKINMDQLTKTTSAHCKRFMNVSEKIKREYKNAKFDMFLTDSCLNRIVSFNKYIIVVWIGDICCGSATDGHYDPKTFIVHGETNEYITMSDVVRTLVENEFEVPCNFKCLDDIIPMVNPKDPQESVYMFSLQMSYMEDTHDTVRLQTGHEL